MLSASLNKTLLSIGESFGFEIKPHQEFTVAFYIDNISALDINLWIKMYREGH